jgi:hypothetical protein
MAHYPHLVQLAWDTVEKLVTDWTKNPHYWELEIDIQSELRSRLSMIYSLTGYGEVEYKEEEKTELRTFRYSRVACEPSIKYVYSDGKEYYAKPDVVVFDKIPDPFKKPDNWPILWACEIKYKSSEKPEWDAEKLGYLLDKQQVQYGCCLTFRIDKSLKEPSVSWEKDLHGTQLWKCTVSAPYSSGT